MPELPEEGWIQECVNCYHPTACIYNNNYCCKKCQRIYNKKDTENIIIINTEDIQLENDESQFLVYIKNIINDIINKIFY